MREFAHLVELTDVVGVFAPHERDRMRDGAVEVLPHRAEEHVFLDLHVHVEFQEDAFQCVAQAQRCVRRGFVHPLHLPGKFDQFGKVAPMHLLVAGRDVGDELVDRQGVGRSRDHEGHCARSCSV